MTNSTEKPIFYDARGHRGVAVRVLGGFSGAASAGALALIVTGVLGFGALPALHPHAPDAALGSGQHRSTPLRLHQRDARADLRAVRFEQATDRRRRPTRA